jgi:large subunit ribosomal protein L25
MEKLILQKREVTGKKVKNLREDGFVPAVVYNSKTESFNTVMSNTDAQWLYKHTTSTTILDAELDGKNFKCLVKDFDINSVTGEINHVSLFEIDQNAVMAFTIPFEIIGISPAVKNNLGVLVNPLTDIEVHTNLAHLVPSIPIDISGLDHPGQTITVRDIKLPEGLDLINDEILDAAIVTITELQKEEVIETPAEGEEVAAAEEETTEEPTEETAATE